MKTSIVRHCWALAATCLSLPLSLVADFSLSYQGVDASDLDLALAAEPIDVLASGDSASGRVHALWAPSQGEANPLSWSSDWTLELGLRNAAMVADGGTFLDSDGDTEYVNQAHLWVALHAQSPYLSASEWVGEPFLELRFANNNGSLKGLSFTEGLSGTELFEPLSTNAVVYLRIAYSASHQQIEVSYRVDASDYTPWQSIDVASLQGQEVHVAIGAQSDNVAIAAGENYFKDFSLSSDAVAPPALAPVNALTFDYFWADGVSKYAVSSCDPLASGLMVIPDAVNGQPVVAIQRRGFQSCSALTAVSLPASLTHINARAFQDCTSLVNVTLPEGLTSLKDAAFSGCSALADLALPDTLQTIGAGAFAGTALAYDASVDGMNFLISASGQSAYLIDGSGATGDLVIPSEVAGAAVKAIAWEAFAGNLALTSVTVPEGVQGILISTFRDCSSLESVTLPDSLKNIGGSAFENCTALTTISLPDALLGIWDSQLQTTALAYDASMDGMNFLISRSGQTAYLIEGRSATGDVRIPSEIEGATVSMIAGGAFAGSQVLTSVTLPDTVETIMTRAFAGCSALQTISLPEGLKTISHSAFGKCELLTQVTIPSTVTHLARYAFAGCIRLERITFAGDAPTNLTKEKVYYSKIERWGLFRVESVVSIYEDAVGFDTPAWEYEDLRLLQPPGLNLATFYESAPNESRTIDATPTSGYPDNFTYQWFFNDEALIESAATANTWTIAGELQNNGSWKVEVSNEQGTTSHEFTYQVFVDADDDGLSDYRESNLIGTDPHDADSDADGLTDGQEVNTYETDPKHPDSDADGLSDFAEVIDFRTDPKAADSDSDGLSDYAETSEHGTDPNHADSDEDALSDGVEILTHFSNPLLWDSSGDGLSDGFLVAHDFDPRTDYSALLATRYTLDEIQDLRVGAEIASVANGAATLQIVLEESADLSNWSHRETVDLVVPLQAGETTKFFRYAMQGAASDDGVEAPAVPDGFALIPGGSFQMGDALDGLSHNAPVVTVNVSAFYMGKYEVTKAEWDEVRTWGLSNGYTDLPSGGGKAADHPVHSIGWYAMVKWCNARSEMEGRTPCYTVSGSTYRTGSSAAVECDWTANGYRLPTEAEWEKAARGGLSGKRFPWGDTISHANANYYERTSYSYDVGDGSGYHPSYTGGSMPYTSPVGSFAANGYGLYDMTGNVWEWCWDWYSSSSYSDGAADPRGASSGSYRVPRGGSWSGNAIGCRLAYRYFNYPSISNDYYGFRVALSSVPQ